MWGGIQKRGLGENIEIGIEGLIQEFINGGHKSCCICVYSANKILNEPRLILSYIRTMKMMNTYKTWPSILGTSSRQPT